MSSELGKRKNRWDDDSSGGGGHHGCKHTLSNCIVYQPRTVSESYVLYSGSADEAKGVCACAEIPRDELDR